jgi:hypothetical protein
MFTYKRIGNYARTGINEVDALLVILCYKAFARERQWVEDTGLSLEAFNQAKVSLLAKGYITKAGAVKKELKEAFWALPYNEGYYKKPEWLKEQLGYISSLEIVLQ